MNGISVNFILFFFKGIPEGFLTVLALYIFTRTKMDIKRYLLLSFILIIGTYLIRFLPIALGVNTVLSLFILIITFLFVYKTQLSMIIRSIVSVICIFILIAIAEVLNMLLLIMVYGHSTAETMFSAKDGLQQSLYSLPSTIFFAFFIITGYLILQQIEKKAKKNGKTGT